jgi:hypothetical protein
MGKAAESANGNRRGVPGSRSGLSWRVEERDEQADSEISSMMPETHARECDINLGSKINWLIRTYLTIMTLLRVKCCKGVLVHL